MKHIVRDGLYPVEFEGELLAEVSTETKRVVRWVELALYKIPPQPDPTGRISLPDGGYLTHVTGQSIVAHTHASACNTGVPTRISDLPPDTVPCEDCNPDFPVCVDPDNETELAVITSARAGMTGLVDLESPRHTLHRSATAGQTVKRITGRQLSTPAQRLLETAATRDPQIAAQFAMPA